MGVCSCYHCVSSPLCADIAGDRDHVHGHPPGTDTDCQ